MGRFMRNGMAVFIALAVLAAGGAAWATDTNSLTVTASVVGTCKFVAPKTSALDFGVIDQSAAGPLPATGSTQFWCTKGVTTAPFTAGNGANYSVSASSMRMAGSSGDYIPYTLTLTPDGNANAGPLTPRTLNFSGSIARADYALVGAGSYTDTVTLTVSP